MFSRQCRTRRFSGDCAGSALAGKGTVSLFATLGPFSGCKEKYMAIAPAQSAAAGFNPRDVSSQKV